MDFNVFEEPLQCGTLDVSTREAAIIVGLREQRPTEVALALDVRLSRLTCAWSEMNSGRALPRSTSWCKPRTAADAGRLALQPSRRSVSPKKRGPFQRVPVTSRAIALRERYR